MSSVEDTMNRNTQKQLNQDLCPLVEEMGVKGEKTTAMLTNAELLRVMMYK